MSSRFVNGDLHVSFYGAGPSPFLSSATMKKHIEDGRFRVCKMGC